MMRLAAIWLLLATAAAAVEPHEMLSDPALEARAQALDVQLRCVVCQSESIASSNSEWAATARVLLREQISNGATDEEAIAFFVDRYGDFARMRPGFGGKTVALWLLAPAAFLIGVIVVVATVRRKPQTLGGLSAEEDAALVRLMQDDGDR